MDNRCCRLLPALTIVFCLSGPMNHAAFGAGPPAPAASSRAHQQGQLVRDTALQISSEELLRMLQRKSGKPVVVDVRRSEEFDRFRIPGSINVPLAALKTKPFLRNGEVVLVYDAPYHPVESEVKKLKTLGFSSLRILQGGLTAWRHAGGALEGDFFTYQNLDHLAAAHFFEDAAYDDWIVIESRAEKEESLQQLAPGAIHIAAVAKDGTLSSQVDAAQEKLPPGRIPFFLLVGGDEEQQAASVAALKAKKIRNYFILDGGVSGYQSFLEDQARILSPEQMHLDRCKTCP